MEELKKIMEREDAKKVIEDIKLKVCGVDLEKLCDDGELLEEVKEDDILNKKLKKTLENAVMCGLVFWSEERNCLCQKLIKPVEKGELKASVLEFSGELTLAKLKDDRSKTAMEGLINTTSLLTGRPSKLIGEIKGQDVEILTACIRFFDL